MYAVLKFKDVKHRLPIVNGRYNFIPQINDPFNMIGNEKKNDTTFQLCEQKEKSQTSQTHMYHSKPV